MAAASGVELKIALLNVAWAIALLTCRHGEIVDQNLGINVWRMAATG